MKFVWEAQSTEVLLNPRLPEAERVALESRVARVTAAHGGFAAHFWVTTSGSTGGIKCVALSKSAVLASAAAVNRHLASEARDVWVTALPAFHVGGLGIWARAHLSRARVVDLCERKWDAHEFHRVCHEEGVTLTALVPTQLFDLVQARLQAPSSLRANVIGGGALSEEVYLAARRLGWQPLPSYGLTECCSQVATASLTSLGAEGVPSLEVLSHAEVQIREGRIAIKSPSLLTGYALEGDQFVDPKHDGWLVTEDAGEFASGALRPLGREGGFLKIAGESVDFGRLEKIFEECRLAAGASSGFVLCALPDVRLGHVVALARESSTDEHVGEKLRHAFDQRVLPVERIRGVHIVKTIPRSPLGKVLKAELLRDVDKTRPHFAT